MSNLATVNTLNRGETPERLQMWLIELKKMQAISSTKLDKSTWFQASPWKVVGEAADKYYNLQPRTLRELAYWFDNCTVGKYPGGPRTIERAIEAASRHLPHSQADVQKVLDENPGCVQPYLTLERNRNGRIVGHILTGHRWRNSSVLLKAVILPKQITTEITKAA